MFHLLLAIIYVSFISLGLPDSLLGSAWPSMYPQLGVPVSYAGMISMIIAVGTVVSSLMSDRLTRRLGTGKVTAFSVATTAAALFGFSFSGAFWQLCLWAIPYGLGAGSVDASLNNYVALHYKSKHMSWLHCMWGVGASAGPYIMGGIMTGGGVWSDGYRCIAIIQVALTAVLFCSLPLWKSRKTAPVHAAGSPDAADNNAADDKPLSIKAVLKIRGVKEILVAFFCYSMVEQTSILWAGSYLTLHKGLAAETAATLAGMFPLGITVGRAVSGFMTAKFSDAQMIRIGQAVIACGVAVMLLPGTWCSVVGFVLTGLGCAPIYPCIIHSTPAHFGADKSQAIIGIQMAFAYVGTCLMPPVFGLIANGISVALLPAYLAVGLALMFVEHERLLKKMKHSA